MDKIREFKHHHLSCRFIYALIFPKKKRKYKQDMIFVLGNHIWPDHVKATNIEP